MQLFARQREIYKLGKYLQTTNLWTGIRRVEAIINADVVNLTSVPGAFLLDLACRGWSLPESAVTYSKAPRSVAVTLRKSGINIDYHAARQRFRIPPEQRPDIVEVELVRPLSKAGLVAIGRLKSSSQKKPRKKRAREVLKPIPQPKSEPQNYTLPCFACRGSGRLVVQGGVPL